MSKYQPLYSSIWSDGKFENYSPNKKLFFIFILTNQFVERSGIYKLSIRQICFYTGLTNELINEFINEFINEGKIEYDFDKSIIFIKKLFHYHQGVIKNKKILLLTLKRNYELVPTKYWEMFFEVYSNNILIGEIKEVLIDESILPHQLYINNNNNNKDKNINKGGMGEEPKTNLELKLKTSNPLTEDFEKFWKDYTPVKVLDGKVVPKGSRKTAIIAYERARKNHSAEKIYEGAAKYLVNCYENNRLSCQAAVFLNQERFLDDYEQTNLEVKKHG